MASHAPYGPSKASNEALLYTGVAVGAVGLGVAIGFGAAALKLHGEEEEGTDVIASDHGLMTCKTPEFPGCIELNDTSDRADAFTVISLVGLSAALTGGAMTAYAIFQPHRKTSAPSTQAAFVVAPGGGGLVFTGRF